MKPPLVPALCPQIVKSDMTLQFTSLLYYQAGQNIYHYIFSTSAPNAALPRARPVVHLETELHFVTPVEGKVDLSALDCVLEAGERVACTQLRLCFRYTGEGVAESLQVEARLELDTRKAMTSRMFFLEREEESVWQASVSLAKEEPSCRTLEVFLLPSIRDKLTALEAQLTVALPLSTAELAPVLGWTDTPGITAKDQVTPGLGRDRPLSSIPQVNIQKDCGEDNVCIPDLRILYSRSSPPPRPWFYCTY